ncbi:ABC transporter permease [Streptococcus pluranimalium]|uniref:ABC transporter permease n=1 Tax=Streptococcus pluranimalium TaxID=82348 RepID=UPI002A7D56D1|nr:ABC transporter permease [Streptococcus pluranimalium]
MEKIIQKRRLEFNQRCVKYLRYVFNDHFVLILMFLLGFLVVQYTNLVNDFPKGSMFPVVLSILVTLALTFLGRIATYLVSADQVFLLPQETFLQRNLKNAARKSFILWGIFQLFVTLLLSPIFLLSGWSLWQFIGYVVVLLILRGIRIYHDFKGFYQRHLLDFTKLIRYEKQRQQRILTFFSLFTTVKGISSTTKPREYLNPLIGLLTKTTTQNVWLALYARAYLRNGDYFWLSLRLLLISLVLGVLLPNWWGLALVGLFNYLLLFQLLGLYRVYDYQIMARLYPVESELQRQAFKTLLLKISLGIGLIQLSLVALDWRFLGIIPIMLILSLVYLPNKLKKFVD